MPMGFWKRLVGLEEKNVRVLTSSDLEKVLRTGGASRSGAVVNWDTALEVSTVLACTRVIAEGVSQVPFRLYRDVPAGRKAATDHPLYRVLYRRPNPWQTSFEFRETMLFHTILTGNGYAFVNRVGRDREVRELIPIEPGRVRVEQQSDYSLVYWVTGRDGSRQDFGQDAIWHLRGPSWNSWLGLDATRLARNAIGLSITLEEGQSDFQRNGARTSGVLSVKATMGPEKFVFLSAWLDKHLPGGERAGKPMIADQDADYKSMSMTGVDQQLLETRKHQIEEICREFRVMPIMIGQSDKAATYASAEQMFLAHVVHTLMPWYDRIEQSADVNLLTDQEIKEGYYAKFTPNALMRGAAKDRAEFYSKALGSGGAKGWMTQNDVRALEELDKSDDPKADELPQPPVAAPAKPDPAKPADNAPDEPGAEDDAP